MCAIPERVEVVAREHVPEKVSDHVLFCFVGRAARVPEQRDGARCRPVPAEQASDCELAGHFAPRARDQRLEAHHKVGFGRAGQTVSVLKAEHLR